MTLNWILYSCLKKKQKQLAVPCGTWDLRFLNAALLETWDLTIGLPGKSLGLIKL